MHFNTAVSVNGNSPSFYSQILVWSPGSWRSGHPIPWTLPDRLFFYTFEDKKWWGINIDALSVPTFWKNDSICGCKKKTYINAKMIRRPGCLKYLWNSGIEVRERSGSKQVVMNLLPLSRCDRGWLLLTSELHYGILISLFRARAGHMVCLTLSHMCCAYIGSIACLADDVLPLEAGIPYPDHGEEMPAQGMNYPDISEPYHTSVWWIKQAFFE